MGPKTILWVPLCLLWFLTGLGIGWLNGGTRIDPSVCEELTTPSVYFDKDLKEALR